MDGWCFARILEVSLHHAYIDFWSGEREGDVCSVSLISERCGRTPLSQTVDSRELVGMPVVTVEGASLGKIKAIRLHPRELRVEGLVVGTGLFAPDVYVDRQDIHALREDAATVLVVPLDLAVGKAVFDVDGWWVGSIREVHRDEDTGAVNAVTVGSEQGLVEVGVDGLLSCQEYCVLKDRFAP
jgi:sporulation protein YlmC with PRC-barrel domain